MQVVNMSGVITSCEPQVAPSITSLEQDDKLGKMALEVRSLNVTWWPDLDYLGLKFRHSARH